MIAGFRHKGLEKFFLSGSTEGIQASHQQRLQLLLTTLHYTTDLQDLRASTFGLHPLKGDWAGFWSLKVNRNWRLVFRFDREHQLVYDVDYIDYH